MFHRAAGAGRHFPDVVVDCREHLPQDARELLERSLQPGVAGPGRPRRDPVSSASHYAPWRWSGAQGERP